MTPQRGEKRRHVHTFLGWPKLDNQNEKRISCFTHTLLKKKSNLQEMCRKKLKQKNKIDWQGGWETDDKTSTLNLNFI